MESTTHRELIPPFFNHNASVQKENRLNNSLHFYLLFTGVDNFLTGTFPNKIIIYRLSLAFKSK